MPTHATSLLRLAFLLALVPGCLSLERAAQQEKRAAELVRTMESPADFGPLEDGREKSHQKLEKKGWVYLFDSRPYSVQWDALGLFRARNPGEPKRNLWSVVEQDGERILRNTITEGTHGTDLISKQNFWDFDIHVELRVPPNSNSGVYLRGRYEIQILSTPAGKEKKLALHDLGAIYSVKAPSVNASRGPGIWQTLEASIRGFRITAVRLNGETIHPVVEIPAEKRKGTGSELGPGDGVSADPDSPGPIFLQGDHGSVEFKNIRLRPLPAAGSAHPLP